MRITETVLLADRVVVTIRWLTLMGLTIYLGGINNLEIVGIVLLVFAGLWNLFLMVWSLADRRLPLHPYLTTIIDIVGAGLMFWNITLEGEPFFYAGILPILTGSFYFGLSGGVVLAVIMAVVEGMVLASTSSIVDTLVVISVPTGVLLLVGLGFGVVAQEIGNKMRRQRMFEISAAQQAEQIERDRIKAIYAVTSALNSTLNFERVLDMTLDLAGSAVSTSDKTGSHMISGFCLFEQGVMYVRSARRFTPGDMKAILPGNEGIIAKALSTNLATFTDQPSQDPELQRVVSLRQCGGVYCYPLRTQDQMVGVLLYGHEDQDFFTEMRNEILEIVGRQAKVSLQNAVLYRELEAEKERIMEVQEEARKKLARDLHDGPTQSVAAIAMRVNFARRLIDRDLKAAGGELFKIEELARRTTKEIRHMLFTLRPLVLESAGLVAALKSMAEKMHETYEQNVVIEADDSIIEYLEMGKQGVIFYIAEEAVNNARKHAEAEQITVRLKKMKGEVILLEIEDDGVGFNVGAVDAGYENRGSLGMVNMRERTEMVNGVIRLDSQEGLGTWIRVWVPLDEDAAEKLRHGTGPREDSPTQIA